MWRLPNQRLAAQSSQTTLSRARRGGDDLDLPNVHTIAATVTTKARNRPEIDAARKLPRILGPESQR
jgi:hypothetical protein